MASVYAGTFRGKEQNRSLRLPALGNKQCVRTRPVHMKTRITEICRQVFTNTFFRVLTASLWCCILDQSVPTWRLGPQCGAIEKSGHEEYMSVPFCRSELGLAGLD